MKMIDSYMYACELGVAKSEERLTDLTGLNAITSVSRRGNESLKPINIWYDNRIGTKMAHYSQYRERNIIQLTP